MVSLGGYIRANLRLYLLFMLVLKVSAFLFSEVLTRVPAGRFTGSVTTRSSNAKVAVVALKLDEEANAAQMTVTPIIGRQQI
jgi:hypothetical protein